MYAILPTVNDGDSALLRVELNECGFRFKTITVKVRYEHFDTFTRARSLSFSTNDLDILKNNGKRLVDQFLRKRKKVRLVGLRVSALKRV